jgi:tRNA-specific 2-thiouridylase
MTNGAGQRVVVAMSGGVDSSMAAAALLERGYEVIGVMLRLWAEDGPAANRCCTPDAVADARRVADALDIPFYVRDYKDVFKTTVVDYFAETYVRGLTPNPCLVCNRQIRFGRLLGEALAMDADFLATGHYARVRQTEEGAYQLLKGVDPAKDQSYVLHRLGQAQLAHALFPLGGYTKPEVREMAQSRGLPVFNRADSQDLCFLGNGDYREFLSRHAPGAAQPGPILDTAGRTLGYPPAGPLPISAKIRYKALETTAVLTPLPASRVRVRFDDPLRDITPGQGVVFYQGDVVLGGATISRPQ